MSTKGSNTVSRHHGETLPTLHVRGKVNGASWGSDCFSVTFSPISFREHVLGCQVLVKPTEPCLFGMLFQFWSFWLHITFSTELNNFASSKTFAKEEAIKATENLKGISTFGSLASRRMLLSFATCTYTAYFIIERNINCYVYAAVTGHQI